MLVGTYLSKAKLDRSYDAVVIGSGLGGLAAAAFLSKAGQKVLVLERHYTAGGFTHSFTRKGYEWDVGLHYVGDVHVPDSVLRRLFDAVTERKLEWAPMPKAYDRLAFGKDAFDLVAGEEAFKEALAERFPRERPAIERYVRMLHGVKRATFPYFGERLLPRWLGRAAYPLTSGLFRRYADRATGEVLSGLTRDPRLKGVLAGQWGDYGLPPAQSSFAIHALVSGHYLDGASYPVGGGSRIAETIEPVIEASGGRVVTKAEVAEILVHGGEAVGVRLADGGEIRAAAVISDAGAVNTFARLLPRGLAAADELKKGLGSVEPSMSHLCLYVGLKASDRELGLEPANQWVFPGYDHDENVRRAMADPQAPFPVLFISFPSARDPSWPSRYPGRATIEVVTGAPYEWFKPWEETDWRKRGAPYEGFKRKLAERLLSELFRLAPQLQGRIDHYELSTPLSTRHFGNYLSGEIYGLSHGSRRFAQRWLRPKTPIRNLYLTGQDVVTAGIGGVLPAGALTAAAVLGMRKSRFLLKLLWP